MNALVLAAAASLVLAQSGDSQVLMSPGTQLTLKHAGLQRVSVADPSVADVNVVSQGGELLLTAKRKGRTTVTLWSRGGKVTTRDVVVDDGRAGEIARMVRETVNPGLEVRSFQGKVVIDGLLDSMEEYHRLQKVTAGDADIVVMAKLNPGVLRALAAVINEAYDKAGLRSARAVVVGGKIFIEGSVTDDEERRKAQTIADAYYDGFSGGGRQGPSGP